MALRSKTFQYSVSLQRANGRIGVVSAGNRQSIDTAPPEDFPEGDRTRWSPEHLYLAAIESCTMLSFLSHAEHADVDVQDYSSDIDGAVMRRAEDGRYAFVQVRHRIRVRVRAGQREDARSIVGKAERDCFVSASTTAHISVDWEIVEE